MVLCACGLQCVVRTSWTNRNPGRRFYSFPTYNSRCPFIGWVDPPMCDRSLDIIPGLLRTRDALEDALALEQEKADWEEHRANEEETRANQAELRAKMEEERAKKLRKYLIITWLMVVMLGVYEQCSLLMVDYAVNVHYGMTSMVQDYDFTNITSNGVGIYLLCVDNEPVE
ncbi:zinc finger, GRF-type [Artemisia annua]|uniref:Zinc finger, GRF-type n=1 Tax=Artemisia annua TaxID=35608 RepID=A0A2U1MS43_ARTAN|nr:zinc finger, GRF-type [Artemisia annua]